MQKGLKYLVKFINGKCDRMQGNNAALLDPEGKECIKKCNLKRTILFHFLQELRSAKIVGVALTLVENLLPLLSCTHFSIYSNIYVIPAINVR